MSRVTSLTKNLLKQSVVQTSFLPSYYRVNDLMWQDGLLIDFLQKKVVDKWVRRFLIISSYLFSERVLFKFIVRFYIDFSVWPLTSKSIFEVSNVSLLLSLTLGSIMLILSIFNLNYLYVIWF